MNRYTPMTIRSMAPALRWAGKASVALLLAACTADEAHLNTLNGNAKTPLNIEATLYGGATASRADGTDASRAYDGTIEQGDVLLSYLRHVTWDGAMTDATPTKDANGYIANVNSIAADQAPKLITVGETYYWDDFSQSTDDGSKDLRTANHYLQSFYGYCYNGGDANISTALTQTTGVLGWTVPADQTTAAAVKKADLLWSGEQTPVRYEHNTAVDADHNTITVPYTHAMSKVTVNVIAGEGYTSADLANTTATLHDFYVNGTFTAPVKTIAVTDDAANRSDISMCGAAVATITGTGTADDGKQAKAFTAMTVPQTVLTAGKKLVTLKDISGTDYTIPVKDDFLTAWQTGLDGTTTRQGVHYVLNVTVNKTAIVITASIKDWDYVYATSIGQVSFSADVKTTDKDNATNAIKSNGAAFDLWRSANGTAYTKETTSTYDATEKKWINTPEVYWANGTQTYFFRGLAECTTTDAGTTYAGLNGSTDVAQGKDILWATTPAHTGTEADGTTTHSYAAGAAINPRTGNVPMEFEHAMSKLSITLETATGDAAVDLTGATVTISNLSTSGTINVADGAITPAATVQTAIDAMAAPVSGLHVIPQTIGNTAIITITLADGTTYTKQLNLCTETDGDDAITEWLRGKHYKYTIHLEKETITFRVLVKGWVDKTGSGNADLDWD